MYKYSDGYNKVVAYSLLSHMRAWLVFMAQTDGKELPERNSSSPIMEFKYLLKINLPLPEVILDQLGKLEAVEPELYKELMYTILEEEAIRQINNLLADGTSDG
jgi:hypothetical protein